MPFFISILIVLLSPFFFPCYLLFLWYLKADNAIKKMHKVIIDDRRIHVDYSQSVSKGMIFLSLSLSLSFSLFVFLFLLGYRI
jgi:hypothetical protein